MNEPNQDKNSPYYLESILSLLAQYYRGVCVLGEHLSDKITQEGMLHQNQKGLSAFYYLLVSGTGHGFLSINPQILAMLPKEHLEEIWNKTNTESRYTVAQTLTQHASGKALVKVSPMLQEMIASKKGASVSSTPSSNFFPTVQKTEVSSTSPQTTKREEEGTDKTGPPPQRGI